MTSGHCRKTGKHKNPKGSAYGAKRGIVWCDRCDAELVAVQPNKKRARRQGKKDATESET